jgi:fatty-acyl-CoA synthase
MTDTKVSIFDQDLPQTPANHAPISPLSFIERTAEVYPSRLAIVHGDLRQDWASTYRRARQLASALTQAGIGKNDTVAVMLPNTPPMVEAHFGIPMAGAVLNALNTRLDPETVAFMLDHGEAKAVIVDPEFAGVMRKALALRQSTRPLLVIDVEDALYSGATENDDQGSHHDKHEDPQARPPHRSRDDRSRPGCRCLDRDGRDRRRRHPQLGRRQPQLGRRQPQLGRSRPEQNADHDHA